MGKPVKIILIILAMFIVTQLIGLFIINSYSAKTTQVLDDSGNLINITSHNLPYGTEPPKDLNPKTNLLSILISIIIAVSVILILMKYKVELFLRIWFFIVVTLALGIAINVFLSNAKIPNASLIALIIALPFSIMKVFGRNLIIHNLTELLIYPGIAAIFVPLLNLWTVVLLLILISLYDMWAVWRVGFMQKMAKYQMEKVRVFPGFFIPHIDKKSRDLINKMKSKSKKAKQKKIKIPIVLLGGGDVVFPLILAGVVLSFFGIIQALIVSAGATAALAGLLYFSEKKAYPAMPFITAGCLIALGIASLI